MTQNLTKEELKKATELKYEEFRLRYNYAKECVDEYFKELCKEELSLAKDIFQVYIDNNSSINKPLDIYASDNADIALIKTKRATATMNKNEVMKDVFEVLDLDIRPFIVNYWLEKINFLFNNKNLIEQIDCSFGDNAIVVTTSTQEIFIWAGNSIYGDTDNYKLWFENKENQ